MTDGILQSILSFVTQVVDLADNVYVYNDNGIQVSVLSFFVALSITGIILIALLNFIRFSSFSLPGGFRERSARSRVRSDKLKRKYYPNSSNR